MNYFSLRAWTLALLKVIARTVGKLLLSLDLSRAFTLNIDWASASGCKICLHADNNSLLLSSIRVAPSSRPRPPHQPARSHTSAPPPPSPHDLYMAHHENEMKSLPVGLLFADLRHEHRWLGVSHGRNDASASWAAHPAGSSQD